MRGLAATARRILGGELDTTDDVADAERRHAAALAELERVQTATSTAKAAAKELFEREGTEAAADDLARVTLRSGILVDAAKTKVDGAAQALAQAQVTARDARLAELDAIVAGVRERVVALEPAITEHAEAILALLADRDRIVTGALQALDEARTLRGQNHEEAYGHFVSLRAMKGAITGALKERLGVPKFEKLEELFR